MVAECPISLECKLMNVVDFPKNDVFIGEIVTTCAEDAVLTDRRRHYNKVRPLLFTMTDQSYWELGKIFAKAWSIGKELK
jgi:flavin reductase (DIM6/NTAB) family NADH-FMN oxidoreductase RutF